MSELRIEFQNDGEEKPKSYVLKHKVITGALLDEVIPIRKRMTDKSMQAELIDLALQNESIFEIVDPMTGGFRSNLSQEEIVRLAQKHRDLIKAVKNPTTNLHTDAEGRALMCEVIQLTADRTAFSEGLSAAFDSPVVDVVEKVKAAKKKGAEQEVVEKVVAETSTFWKTFPVEVMIEYVETFCARARI